MGVGTICCASAEIRRQLICQTLEVSRRQRTSLRLFLPAGQSDSLLSPEHDRPLTDGNFHLAGADEAASLPAFGGDDEIGAADGDGDGRRADPLVAKSGQLVE